MTTLRIPSAMPALALKLPDQLPAQPLVVVAAPRALLICTPFSSAGAGTGDFSAADFSPEDFST